MPRYNETSRSRLLWLRITTSVVFILLIIYFSDVSEVFSNIAEANMGWLGVAIIFQFFGPIIISLRWRQLLAVQDVLLPWRYLFLSTLISTFFRQFLPSIVGGDIVRAHHAVKAGASMSISLMSLLVDRLSGMVALLVFAIVGVAVGGDITDRLPGIWRWLAAAGVLLGALVVLLTFGAPKNKNANHTISNVTLIHKARLKLSNIANSLRIYRGKFRVLLNSLLLSFALQANIVAFVWAISRALNMQVPFGAFFVVVPVATIVMMLPISINGIGLREGIYVFLLGSWGVSPEVSLSLAWIEYGIFLFFGLIGGAIYGN